MREILSQLRPGDHAALFYRNRAEQFELIPPFSKALMTHREAVFVRDVKAAFVSFQAEPSCGEIRVDSCFQTSGRLENITC
jgi:hypothetical protein